MQDLFRVLLRKERPGAERSEHYPRHQIAEDGGYSEPPRQRSGESQSGKQNREFI
jgi:hypothetical protein